MSMKRTHWNSSRGIASFLALVLLTSALAGVCVLADNLEKNHGWRRDFSFNAVTTHSEVTEAVLAELKTPVHIYALFSAGNEDGPLMELLNRYAAASPMVTWERADLSLNPSLATRYRGNTSSEVVSSDCLIVACEETQRFRILDWGDFLSLGYKEETGTFEMTGLTYESSLTSAIEYVTRDTIPRIMILQGQGELDEEGTAMLADLLVSNQYDVHYFTLNSREADLKPGDLLVILSPVRDFLDSEMEMITDFAHSGGSILFTCDYSDPVENMPNYRTLLRYYGMVPRDGIVIASDEEPQTYYDDRQLLLIPSMQSTPVTENLLEERATTLLMAGTRAFEIPGETDNDLSVRVHLMSGSRAWLRSLQGDLSVLDQQEGDAMGPFALGLDAERLTESGEVSRAVVIGCSTVFTSGELYAMTDSQEYTLRCVEYLLGEKNRDLNIMAKTAVRPQMSVEGQALGKVLVAALPLAVLAAALIVLIPRSRK